MGASFAHRSHTTRRGSDSGSGGTTRHCTPRPELAPRRRSSDPVRVPGGTDLGRLGRVAYTVLLIIAIAAVIASLVLRPAAPRPDTWSSVTVGEADSLWTLAKVHSVTGLSTAETASLIAETNDLPSTVIIVGQTIRVPSSSGNELLVASNQ